MGIFQPEIDEERLLRILLDEIDGRVDGQLAGRRGPDLVGIVVQGIRPGRGLVPGRPVAVPGPRIVVPVLFHERRVRVTVDPAAAAEMPFAVVRGAIPVLLHQPRQRRRAEIQPVWHVPLGVVVVPREMGMDLPASRVMAGDETAPARRTDRAGDIEPVEPCALFGEPVEAGCPDRLDATACVAFRV